MIEEEQTHRNFLRRDRENRCFMTFPNTTEAIKMEAACHGAGLLGRLVPVPGEITAGCGLGWRMLPEDWEAWNPRLDGAGYDAATPIMQ